MPSRDGRRKPVRARHRRAADEAEGVDPAQFFAPQPESRESRGARRGKTEQVCALAAREVGAVLDTRSPVPAWVDVACPAPDVSRLEVVVMVDAATAAEMEVLRTHGDSIAAEARQALAAALQRPRTPHLRLVFVPVREVRG